MWKAAGGLLGFQLGHSPVAPASSAGPITKILTQAVQLLLLLCRVEGILYQQQNISSSIPNSFCGFFKIQRYRAWCESSISAFVASNTSCQRYGTCVPLDGDDAMPCTSKPSCSGYRPKGTPQAACLVLQGETADNSVVVCDVEILGPSIFDLPPPGPTPPTLGVVNSVDTKHRDWAVWKTMAIIWSILGFTALIVIAVLLLRWCLKRRAQAATTPSSTALSAEGKRRIEQAALAGIVQAGGGGGDGDTDATITMWPVAPDGKPILAFGATYPPPLLLPLPAPTPLAVKITATASGTRLPPNAGDALIQAAADTRPAVNSTPMRAPLVNIPPSISSNLPRSLGFGAADGAVPFTLEEGTLHHRHLVAAAAEPDLGGLTDEGREPQPTDAAATNNTVTATAAGNMVEMRALGPAPLPLVTPAALIPTRGREG